MDQRPASSARVRADAWFARRAAQQPKWRTPNNLKSAREQAHSGMGSFRLERCQQARMNNRLCNPSPGKWVGTHASLEGVPKMNSRYLERNSIFTQ